MRDDSLMPVIAAMHQENYGVYGVRKMHAALRRAQVRIGRDQTARLMRQLGPGGSAARAVQADHDTRSGREPPGGSGQPRVPRAASGPAVGL